MRGLLPVLVAALVCCSPASAAAQTPNQDFVIGTAGFGDPQFGVTASVDAHSGPSGENATGTATFGARQTFFGGPVTCLNVTGNRAVIGGDSGFASADGGTGCSGVPALRATTGPVLARAIRGSPGAVCPPAVSPERRSA